MKNLSLKERFFLVTLGVPSFGLSLVYTLVTTYLPYFIENLSNAAITGILVSAEGIFALTIPFLIGSWSDSISTPIGKRLPFFFAGVLFMSFTLVMMPFSSDNLFLLWVEFALFFISYFTIYEAYYALYPDVVSYEQRNRSQGILGGFRSFGMLLALVGGGFLIDVWKPLPFLLFTVILLIVTVVLYFGVREKIRSKTSYESIEWHGEWELIRRPRS